MRPATSNGTRDKFSNPDSARLRPGFREERLRAKRSRDFSGKYPVRGFIGGGSGGARGHSGRGVDNAVNARSGERPPRFINIVSDVRGRPSRPPPAERLTRVPDKGQFRRGGSRDMEMRRDATRRDLT